MYLIKRVLWIHVLLSAVLYFACNSHNYTDPFWNISYDSDNASINTKLYQSVKLGAIRNGIFSYEKVFYVRNSDFDARVTSSLNNPLFEKGRLKKLSYSLLADFKNEKTEGFNTDFFNYVLKEISRINGKPEEAIYTDQQIKLKWALKDKKVINILVVKELNDYSVVFEDKH